ncbi:MAG: trypsin-like peptidase domain-containing protein [Gemmatirosa sp.]
MSGSDVVFGSFWQLSDLRIAAQSSASDDAQATVRAELLARAEDAARGGARTAIDAVVVTGDLLAEPAESHAREANDFLLTLADALRLAPDRVVVVPGRRDLDPLADTPEARAAHFRTATAGCTTADGRVRLHVIGETGLAFLLIDVLAADQPPGAARLLGRLGPHVPEDARDAWRLTQPWLERALIEYARIDPRPLRGGGRGLRDELLAFAVSYLPLTSPPSDDSRELFPVPAGAGRAKLELLKLGVDGCLYGPAFGRHVHSERLGAADGSRHPLEFASIGGPSLHAGAHGRSPAFHLLEYVRGCAAAEARVRVRMVRLDGRREGEPELLSPSAHAVRPARASRMTVKINEQGDARVDVWRQGVPTTGWEEEGSARVARVPVQFAERNPGQRPPQVSALNAGMRAEFRRASGDDAAAAIADGMTRPGEIVLTADQDLEYASYAYRRFAPAAYATSVGDRVRGYLHDDTLPGLTVEQEACVQFFDTRYRRAELFIRTPFPPTHAELRTYVRRPRAGGEPELIAEPRLLRFSRWSVEWWGDAHRIRAVIDRPLCGVGYGIVWTIPEGAVGMPAYDASLIERAVRECEALRRDVLAARDARSERWAAVREALVTPFFDWVREVVRAGGTLSASEELEIGLMLPTRQKLTVPEFRERYPDLPDPPGLGTIATTLPDAGHAFRAALPAGRGIAGRAYVTNKGTEYVSPDAGRGRGALPGIGNVYVPLDAPDGRPRQPHTVLYALPLRHWDVPAVVAGCLCVGSRQLGSRLELKWQHAETLMFAFQLLALEGGQLIRRIAQALREDGEIEPWRPLPAAAWRPVAASDEHRGYWQEVGPGLTTLFLPAVHPVPVTAAPVARTAEHEAPPPRSERVERADVRRGRKMVAKLRDVLVSTLPSEAALDALLYRTGRSLEDVLARDEHALPVSGKAFGIARRAEDEGWMPELLAALREELPDDPTLLSLAARGGLLAPWRGEARSLADLEARIGQLDRFYDPARFVAGLMAAEWRICRLEVRHPTGESSCGTGFLVGPDRVLTCCHVLEPLFTPGGEAPRAGAGVRDVTLRFDFRRTAEGQELRGVAHWLHPTDWHVAHSPIGALDYVLLRLDGAPGNTPPGGDSGAQQRGARPRGWVELTAPPILPQPNQLLLVMQHPVGEPLAMAIGTQTGDLPAAGDAVLRYTTRTEKGSSGAPCFDAQWGLVALHRGAEPGDGPPRANEGRLMAAILEDLHRKATSGLSELGIHPLPH